MKTIRFLVLLGLITGIIYSCKKDFDNLASNTSVNPAVEQAKRTLKTQTERDFFDFDFLTSTNPYVIEHAEGRNDDELINDVYEYLLLLNQEENFAIDMIDKYGYPAWNSAVISPDTSDFTILLPQIPLAKTNEDFVSAYLIARPGSAPDVEPEWSVYLIDREEVDSLILTENSFDYPGLGFDILTFIDFDQTLFGTEDDEFVDWVWDKASEGLAPETATDRCNGGIVCKIICITIRAFVPNEAEDRGCPAGQEASGVEYKFVGSAGCGDGGVGTVGGPLGGPVGGVGYGGPTGGGGGSSGASATAVFFQSLNSECGDLNSAMDEEELTLDEAMIATNFSFDAETAGFCGAFATIYKHGFLGGEELQHLLDLWLTGEHNLIIEGLANFIKDQTSEGQELSKEIQQIIKNFIQRIGQTELNLLEFVELNLTLIDLDAVFEFTLEEEQWLLDNPEVAEEYSIFEDTFDEYYETFQEDMEFVGIAGQIVLDLIREDKLESDFETGHKEIYNNHEATFPNPVFYYFYMLECAQIRLEHPDWSNTRISLQAHFNILLEGLHLSLDIVGLIPAVGEVADITNGVIYTLEGDGVNAALSYSAAIPVAGWFATGTKWGRRIILGASGRKVTLNFIVDPVTDIIQFGDRSQLRRVIKPASGHQAHHIIPWEKGNHDLVQEAAKGTNPFHLNDHLNGIGLPKNSSNNPNNLPIHNGSHPNYSAQIQNEMDKILTDLGSNLNPQTAKEALEEMTEHIRDVMANNPNIPINQLDLGF